MKPTGALKKKAEAAESRGEAKRTVADAGMELTGEELDAVSGGGMGFDPFDSVKIKFSVNQTVRVVKGLYKGSIGTVVSLCDPSGNMLRDFNGNREYKVALTNGGIDTFTADYLSAVD